MEILRTENLTFSYPEQSFPTIENISIKINRGEFITLCGATGSGKSTFLKMLKREISPRGNKSGRVFYMGEDIESLSPQASAFSIGYVMQRPEQQIVTDKVWHELAFGLENLNLPKDVISRRVAEMASYFGIEEWFQKDVDTLSGGQKQMLNLASIMVMNPKILILDEPTSQLDPIAASDFVSTLKKINQDLSVTIIIAEHRLEDLIPITDKMLILDKGKVLGVNSPSVIASKLQKNSPVLNFMPMATRLHVLLENADKVPFSVKEGREYIEKNFENQIKDFYREPLVISDRKVVEISDAFFKYERNLPDVISSLNLEIYENEIFCILGGNGSGKTTLLNMIAGLEKPYSGTIKILGKKIKDYKNQTLYKNCISYLPQDVQTVFLAETVEEELKKENILPFDISHLLKKHPYDLSGGEQQIVALAKVLETEPKILLLDEPTKGIDPDSKLGLIKVIKKLKSQGMTLIIVTHDVEFSALCADRCAMLFNGNISSSSVAFDFFNNNNFYTTSVNKMSREYYNGAITIDDLITLCQINKRKGGAK